MIDVNWLAFLHQVWDTVLMTNQPVLVDDYLPTPDRSLKVGDLATFLTYNNKQIGGSITRMWAAGEISNSAQVEIRVIGDQGCYKNGSKLTVDAAIVQRAV